ncbi:MAG TPA: hypothetical protein PKH65_07145 [Bacteroidia bacterium]|nr:hypothetical protein [Bacteroidia bacterium]HNT80443.1 hypothetical protein [Bacteroidia bacterium]
MNKTFKYVSIILFFSINNLTAQVPPYVPLQGLQAWYSYNGNVNDLSGNGNTPVNTGVTFGPDRFNTPNSSSVYNGSSSVLTLAAPSFTFAETGSFSYSVWMKKQSTPSTAVLMMSGVNTAGYFISIMQGNNSQNNFGVNIQQSSWTWATCPNTLNVWEHYVGTYNAGLMKLYKNGTLITTSSYNLSGAIAANLPFYFGRGLPGATNYFSGSLDDIGIWNRELTPNEVMNLYNPTTDIASNIAVENFKIYPNPSSSFIRVHNYGKYLNINYKLINNKGQTILKGLFDKEINDIEVTHLEQGLYTLIIDNVTIKKVLVLRD